MSERLRVGVNGRVLAVPSMRGLTRYATGLLRALSQRDDVELVIFTREPPHPEHIRDVRAEVVRIDAARELVWDEWGLPRRIRDAGVTVFHALADRGLPLRKPCPMVVTVHGSYEREHWRALFRGAKQRLWYWKHELANALRADVVVTVSDTTRVELAARRICDPSKLASIHLAAGSEFSPTPLVGDRRTRRAYGITGPYLLYVGGYDAHKNVDALVQAFELADLPDVELVLVAAKTSAGAALERRWRGLRCFPRLRLIEPTCEALPGLYRGATALVHPSLCESFGLQLVEAMACGLPVLASHRSAIPETLAGAGLLFEPTDAPQLAGLIRDVVRDRTIRADLRRRGLARARDFSWDATAADTVAAYRRALAA